ncbi:hypothetical protein ACLOJK_002610 [Asimina triloba]
MENSRKQSRVESGGVCCLHVELGTDLSIELPIWLYGANARHDSRRANWANASGRVIDKTRANWGLATGMWGVEIARPLQK